MLDGRPDPVTLSSLLNDMVGKECRRRYPAPIELFVFDIAKIWEWSRAAASRMVVSGDRWDLPRVEALVADFVREAFHWGLIDTYDFKRCAPMVAVAERHEEIDRFIQREIGIL